MEAAVRIYRQPRWCVMATREQCGQVAACEGVNKNTGNALLLAQMVPQMRS